MSNVTILRLQKVSDQVTAIRIVNILLHVSGVLFLHLHHTRMVLVAITALEYQIVICPEHTQDFIIAIECIFVWEFLTLHHILHSEIAKPL